MLQVKMKRSTQADIDMFNKMSKVSKPTRPAPSEEMQQVHDRQDQVAITSSSIQFEASKDMYLLYPAKNVFGVIWKSLYSVCTLARLFVRKNYRHTNIPLNKIL